MFFLVSFGFLATAHAAVVADLSGDYAAAKTAGFTEGQQAVLAGTYGTWTFSNVNNQVAIPYITSFAESYDPAASEADGLTGPRTISG